MKLFFIIIFFIFISILLAWYLISHDKGPKEPIKALWFAFILGIVGAIGASLLEQFFVSQKGLQTGSSWNGLFKNYLLVGLIEESVKFVPLALFIYKKKYFNEHTDGVIYFALVGLGFGLPENILYALSYGSATGIGRLFLTPFFHATTVSLVGFYLAQHKISHKSFSAVIYALFGVVVLHTIYDFGLSSGNSLLTLLSIIITTVLSVNLFVIYRKASLLDQSIGLAEVGINRYCRNCGWYNTHSTIYCTRCGVRA